MLNFQRGTMSIDRDINLNRRVLLDRAATPAGGSKFPPKRVSTSVLGMLSHAGSALRVNLVGSMNAFMVSSLEHWYCQIIR